MEAKRLVGLTIEEYLKVEKETQTRYEYHDGSIFALAGGTVEHGLISGNVFGEIKMALRNAKNSCRPLNGEVRLRIETLNKMLYPDVMAVCGDIQKSATDENSITNPILIVEVLSNSTESYDRGDKFFAYRQIPSLEEYVLIDQYKALVEIYKREKGLWKITRVVGLDESVELASLNITIALKNIYEDVNLEG